MVTGSSVLRKSLAEDEVDRYTSTWAALLFALLALIAFLVPFSGMLALRGQRSPSPASNDLQPAKVKVKTTCWAPAQFEQPQVDYTNRICTEMANALLDGIDSPGGSFVKDEGHDVPRFIMAKKNLSKNKAKPEVGTENASSSVPDEDLRTDNDIGDKTQELVTFRAPLILALLALCLWLPRLLWSVVSSCTTSGLNVHHVLESCLESRCLDAGTQRQIQEETAAAVSESIQQSGRTTSSLFLFMKVMAVVVVLAETVFICQFIVPDIQAMEMEVVNGGAVTQTELPSGVNNVDVVSGDDVTETTVSPTAFDQEDANATAEAEAETEAKAKADAEADDSGTETPLFVFPNNIYHCFFRIRRMSYTHDYTVQCIVSKAGDGESKSEPPAVGGATPLPLRGVLQLYQALFTAVLAVLAILLIANVFSTFSWVLRLSVGSYAASMGLPSNAAKDVVLLVSMARLNAGPRVARGLAGSSDWSSGFRETEKKRMVETSA